MKLKLNREFYIPKTYVEYKPRIGDYPKDMFAVWVDRETPKAIFFIGKQSKPTWHYSFKDNGAMKEKVNTQISNLMSWYDEKVERAEKRKNRVSGLKVGDILYSSWGYDQTNIDFYQVTKTIGTKMVEVRQIASKVVSSGTTSNDVVAIKDAFLSPGGEWDKTGLPMKKRVGEYGISISSYAHASLWNGKPLNETASGYGH